MSELVQFGEVIVDLLVFIGKHDQGLLRDGDACDGSDTAVEDARLAFGVVVAQLNHLVSHAEHAVAVAFLCRCVALRGERVLQQGVESARAGGSAVRWSEYLYVADRVQPEFAGDAAVDDVDHELRGLLCWLQS